MDYAIGALKCAINVQIVIEATLVECFSNAFLYDEKTFSCLTNPTIINF
jgi:hypothetical protein